ncbi:MAG: hypothetical protein JWQ36_1294, partial [Enterovirga sp.]|nr:hypothetical protein [Enterovirga sp.]
MKGTVGIIGLGIMGGSIARNLAERGWEVVGFDLSPERRDEAAAAGVKLAPDVADVARRAEFIITSLPSPAAVAATASAIAASGVPSRVVAEASTLSLEDKLAFEAALKAAGHVGLDCPLSGTGAQAAVRDLVVYGSGDSAAIARMMPIFADFSREAHDLGVFGNGTRMKLVANLL